MKVNWKKVEKIVYLDLLYASWIKKMSKCIICNTRIDGDSYYYCDDCLNKYAIKCNKIHYLARDRVKMIRELRKSKFA